MLTMKCAGGGFKFRKKKTDVGKKNGISTDVCFWYGQIEHRDTGRVLEYFVVYRILGGPRSRSRSPDHKIMKFFRPVRDGVSGRLGVDGSDGYGHEPVFECVGLGRSRLTKEGKLVFGAFREIVQVYFSVLTLSEQSRTLNFWFESLTRRHWNVIDESTAAQLKEVLGLKSPWLLEAP